MFLVSPSTEEDGSHSFSFPSTYVEGALHDPQHLVLHDEAITACLGGSYSYRLSNIKTRQR